ncbi:MAG: hypothetical protein HYZ28_06875 [Myxococcales bacterium]|nr:hypothetical protein [Myxococcales bacterium]
MAENMYLLKVTNDVASWVSRRLMMSKAPSHVRLATEMQLSNYGYPPNAVGALLQVNEDGLVVGVEGKEDVPRAFVPWSNVGYLADGAGLGK